MAYTIDGDLYQGEGPLTISVGPHIDFVSSRQRCLEEPRRVPALPPATTSTDKPMR